MVRVAATADVHFGHDSAGTLRPHLEHLCDRADVLLIAGDLTRCGGRDEAQVLADELRGLEIPIFAVLGNHDYEVEQPQDVIDVLRGTPACACSTTRTRSSTSADVRVGITGVKGFGGGFAGACGSDFGEPEMKAFIRHTKATAQRLEELLGDLDTDVRSRCSTTPPSRRRLRGERLEIYPFLGSYLLAEAIDRAGADLVLHGHAHNGAEKGLTPGGIAVRNVAQPVIRQAYAVYELEPSRIGETAGVSA